MKFDTQAAQIGLSWDTRTGSVAMPIYQSATFRHPGIRQSTGFDYSRSKNPTRQALEDGIALLDGGTRGFAFASGLAALTTVLMTFSSGDHLIVTEDLYGGSRRLFDKLFTPYGLSFSYVDTSDEAVVSAAIKPNTRAIFFETLSNPILKFADIPAIVRFARARGLLLIADNTFLTPYFLKPLDLGVDIVLHSGSKYLSGHNDLIAGVVTTKDEGLVEAIYFRQNAVGAILGPQDAWLLMRGIKTLSLRLERQAQNAHKIAEVLAAHPAIAKVHYPGLATHPHYERMKKGASGFGAMISFEVEDKAKVESLLLKTRLISFAESLGGVETLITYPEVQTHADIPEKERVLMGINDRLLRLSVGIEDVEDLIEDLLQALL